MLLFRELIGFCVSLGFWQENFKMLSINNSFNSENSIPDLSIEPGDNLIIANQKIIDK